jgi:hypothetical protein
MNDLPEQVPADEADEESTDDELRPAERAAFLDDFPDSPELLPLIHAFETGNYAYLRKLERSLQQHCTDPELLASARELVERTEADPTAKKLLLLSVGFFVFTLIWVYGSHGH